MKHYDKYNVTQERNKIMMQLMELMNFTIIVIIIFLLFILLFSIKYLTA